MKKILIILFAVLSFAQVKTFGLEQQFSGGDKEEIIKLLINNQYEKVIKIIEGKDEQKLAAEEWFYLGQSYSHLMNLKKAVNAFERCVKLDSNSINYRLNFARTLNQIGRTSDAVTNYLKVIDADSTNVQALYDLGILYVNRKDFISAVPIFKELSDLNKSDFLSAYYFALSSYQTAVTPDDTLKADDLIFHAKQLNFEYIPSFELSATYHLNKNDFDRAYYDYTMLTKLNPNNDEYFYRAGFCAEKMKNYDTAVVFFNKALNSDSTITNYYSHLGYAYFMIEKYDSSLTAYIKAAELDPENAASYLNLGLVYEKIDSLDLAKTAYEKALELYPYSKIVFNTEKLISIDYRLKKYEQVLLLCEQVLAIAPNSTQSLFYSACSYDALGKTKPALSMYEKAAEQLKKNENYKSEYKYVTDQIEKINAKERERKFWEGGKNQ